MVGYTRLRTNCIHVLVTNTKQKVYKRNRKFSLVSRFLLNVIDESNKMSNMSTSVALKMSFHLSKYNNILSFGNLAYIRYHLYFYALSLNCVFLQQILGHANCFHSLEFDSWTGILVARSRLQEHVLDISYYPEDRLHKCIESLM